MNKSFENEFARLKSVGGQAGEFIRYDARKKQKEKR